jgi:hypothetical protein
LDVPAINGEGDRQTSYVDVPLPNSSRMTRDFDVAIRLRRNEGET